MQRQSKENKKRKKGKEIKEKKNVESGYDPWEEGGSSLKEMIKFRLATKKEGLLMREDRERNPTSYQLRRMVSSSRRLRASSKEEEEHESDATADEDDGKAQDEDEKEEEEEEEEEEEKKAAEIAIEPTGHDIADESRRNSRVQVNWRPVDDVTQYFRFRRTRMFLVDDVNEPERANVLLCFSAFLVSVVSQVADCNYPGDVEDRRRNLRSDHGNFNGRIRIKMLWLPGDVIVAETCGT
ncbi:hypothetical protein K0M31_011455 [Melipona bicolor]|uniref:Uncharacterized protein n=1 Tax=Melipona bicolor TaxID=60889 RepID=A0AA40GAT8_9HYME|nr:hypothetical protein K0M31_011455 [Melipona bicolor]